jgi:BASS family bile acid:Na+ symporter
MLLLPGFEGGLDAAYAVVLAITLCATGIALGASIRPRQILDATNRPGLIARVIALDMVLIPVVMWACVRLLVPDSEYATGLLLVAFASAGPLGIKLAQVAGGDVAYAIGIVVVLEVANVLVVPAWATLLIPGPVATIAVDMARTLLIYIALPITVGLLLKRWRPVPAAEVARISQRASDLGLVAVLALVLIRHAGFVLDAVGSGAPVAAAITVGFALAAGWLLGGPARGTRITSSLVTGVRANGVALAIAASSFAGMPRVEVGILVFGLFSVFGPTVFAVLIANRTERRGIGVDATLGLRSATPRLEEQPWRRG